jgi:hypothetical protein
MMRLDVGLLTEIVERLGDVQQEYEKTGRRDGYEFHGIIRSLRPEFERAVQSETWVVPEITRDVRNTRRYRILCQCRDLAVQKIRDQARF